MTDDSEQNWNKHNTTKDTTLTKQNKFLNKINNNTNSSIKQYNTACVMEIQIFIAYGDLDIHLAYMKRLPSIPAGQVDRVPAGLSGGAKQVLVTKIYNSKC